MLTPQPEDFESTSGPASYADFESTSGPASYPDPKTTGDDDDLDTPDRGEIRDLAARNLFGKTYETLLLEQARAIDSMNAGRLRVEVRNMTARRRFGRPFAELTPEQARVVVMTKSRPGSAVNAAVMDRASSKPAAPENESQPARILGYVGVLGYLALLVPILFPVAVAVAIPAFAFWAMRSPAEKRRA